MLSTIGLKGPFRLNAETLRVTALAKLPGAYMLGHTNDEGTFIVEKIGRSDADLKETLQNYTECYSQFSFEHFHSAKAAFEKECDLYHNLMVGASYIHPARPEGSYWKCPHCKELD